MIEELQKGFKLPINGAQRVSMRSVVQMIPDYSVEDYFVQSGRTILQDNGQYTLALDYCPVGLADEFDILDFLLSSNYTVERAAEIYYYRDLLQELL